MNHRAQHSPHQHADQGIAGGGDKLLEGRIGLEKAHGLAHGMKPLKQDAEAQNYLPHMFFHRAFGKQQEDRADKNTDWGQGGDIQRDHDAGDRCPDIGANDYARGLG